MGCGPFGGSNDEILASTPRDDVPNLIIKEKPMKHSKNILNVWIGIVLALASTPVVLTLVNNPDLKEAERQKLIRQAADKRFHWTAIARSAMGVYWQNLTQEQKREFTGLFTDLIESIYIEKIESYSGEKILYLGDDTDDGYGTVKMSIITHKGTEIPISYRVVEEKGQWFIYDVRIEGISMVNNYRKQISYIMNNSSYEALVKKLKEKIEAGDDSSQ
jgi:phospholipid transport system substrate-binding protein